MKWGNEMKYYNSVDREIIHFLQGDIPLESEPYKQLAQSIGLSEEEIITRIEFLIQNDVIRRLGAILRHHKAGFKVNAMVVWKVDDNLADEAGQKMAQFNEISHCYLRKIPECFKYNLFTMIHARTEEELSEVINRVSAITEINDYKIIKSIKELKKSSMIYFE